MTFRETAHDMAIDFEIFMSGGDIQLLSKDAKREFLEICNLYPIDTTTKLWGLTQEQIAKMIQELSE